MSDRGASLDPRTEGRLSTRDHHEREGGGGGEPAPGPSDPSLSGESSVPPVGPHNSSHDDNDSDSDRQTPNEQAEGELLCPGPTSFDSARRRPRPDVESKIGAAIAARRRQHVELERFSAALALEDDAKEKAARDDHDDDDKDDGYRYEYLDHTADVQLHAWGDDMPRALEGLVVSMFGYMTDLRRVRVDVGHGGAQKRTVCVRGARDKPALVFQFLQEWLSVFHETGFVARRVRVVGTVDNTASDSWSVEAVGTGELYDPTRHTQGTEVKAVTYGSLKVTESEDGRCDIWVIVDI